MCVCNAPLQNLVLLPVLPRKRGKGRPAKPACTVLTAQPKRKRGRPANPKKPELPREKKYPDHALHWLCEQVDTVRTELRANGRRATTKDALAEIHRRILHDRGRTGIRADREVIRNLPRMQMLYSRARGKALS